MSRALFTFAVLCALAASLHAQDPPDETTPPAPPTTADLIEAVANTAAIFARTAPGLLAQEVLHQHGRRGFIQTVQQSQRNASKKKPASKSTANNVTVKLPQEFHTHDVVSEYTFGQIGDGLAIHELRSILTIDGRVISAADEARHALAIGVQSADDELKHRLLENFERNRLEGAVTDFGQLILLFSAAAQSHYRFTPGHERLLHGQPMTTLEYKQISGAAGLTVFHDRSMDVRLTEGEIWLGTADLLPLRITMSTEAPVGGDLTIHDSAVVDYTPTDFGLAPSHIDYMQFLGPDLLVENDLQYSGYQRLTPGIVP